MIKSILLIEDSRAIQNEINEFFKGKHNLKIVDRAEDALELIFFFGEEFDLIITDIILLGMNGLEFVKKIRDVNKWVPIIVITGRSTHDTAHEAANLYISGYFFKPLNFIEFGDRVNEALWSECNIAHFPKLKLNIDKKMTEAHPYTIRTIIEIHRKFHSKISLTILSETIGISLFHLCRIFKKDCGITIHEYLNSFRLELAKKMVRDSDYSISDVIELTGFKNRTLFFKNFKKFTGRTPKQFRNNTRYKIQDKPSSDLLKPCIGWGILLFLFYNFRPPC